MAQWQRICLPSRRWGFDPWIEIIPCRRKWKPTPMFFPEKPWTEDLVRLDHGITKQSELVTKQPWMLKKRCCLVTKSVQHFGNHLDFSPPCSFVHGISQARTLEWFAISFSRGTSWPKDQIHISCISCIGRQVLYHCAFRRIVQKGPEGPTMRFHLKLE